MAASPGRGLAHPASLPPRVNEAAFTAASSARAGSEAPYAHPHPLEAPHDHPLPVPPPAHSRLVA